MKDEGYASQKDYEESTMVQDVEESLDKALPIPSEKKPTGAEAPASATVHAWNADNFGVLFTIRDTDAKNLYARLKGFLTVLKADGWKPDWKNDAPPAQAAIVGQPAAPTTKPTQVCGIHGTPMKWMTGKYKTSTSYHQAGDSFAFWSCPTLNVDKSYCKYKPGK